MSSLNKIQTLSHMTQALLKPRLHVSKGQPYVHPALVGTLTYKRATKEYFFQCSLMLQYQVSCPRICHRT